MLAIKTWLENYASYNDIRDCRFCGTVAFMQQKCSNVEKFEQFKLMASGWFLHYFTCVGYRDEKLQKEIDKRLHCLDLLVQLDMNDNRIVNTVASLFSPYTIYQCPNSIWTLLVHTQETDDKIICPCGVANPCNPYDEARLGNNADACICHHVRYLEPLTIDQALDKAVTFRARV